MKLDHTMLFNESDRVQLDNDLQQHRFPFEPTAENLAWYIGNKLNEVAEAKNRTYRYTKVEFWETENNHAIWILDD
jgi:6-pyruvoyl-tetrahydropterin synthase